MKKHWQRGILLGVSVALLLAVGGLVGLLVRPGVASAQEPWLEAGDAPTSWNNHGNAPMTAYPWLDPGSARFPVVSPAHHPGPPPPGGYGICHAAPICSHLGDGKSWEYDADLLDDDDGVTNIDPLLDIADRDGFDDGVEFPSQMPECRTSYVNVSGEVLTAPFSSGVFVGFVNAWFDWNRDGDWADTNLCACNVDEWAVRDVQVQPGPFSLEIPVMACHPVSDTDPVWVRVTLSEESMESLMQKYPGKEWMAGGMPRTHAWCIGEGETEDYYVEFEPEFVPEWGSIALLGSGLTGLAGYATLRLRSGQALRWRSRE